MPIVVFGSVGGPLDGNPEHGAPTPIQQQFDTVDEAIIFMVQKTVENPSQGNLNLNWYELVT